MKPIREGDGDFFVEGERRARIMNDQGTPETIRVLAGIVRVVPIGARLISLTSKIIAILKYSRLTFHR